MVANALIEGKLGYGAAAVFSPRMADEDANEGTSRDLQVLINDVARCLLGERRGARTKAELLLLRTGLPSLNRYAARAIAVEVWKTASGFNGPLNPLQDLLGVPGRVDRPTRAAAAGHLPPPLTKASRTFVWEAHKMWNNCPELRAAKTIRAAKRVAVDIAKQLPL